MLKTLTAILIFSIIWFAAVVWLGIHFHQYLVYPQRDMPLLYIDGIGTFVSVIVLKRWFRR